MATFSYLSSVGSGSALVAWRNVESSRQSAVTLEARKVSCAAQDAGAHRRREAEFAATKRQLLAVGAAAPVLWAFSEPALAADIVQQKQRAEYRKALQDKLLEAVEANSELVPDFLRLALNDAATYDKATKTGGANGSIRFKEELARPENRGLEKPLAVLEGVKKAIDEEFAEKGGPVSYADLIQFGGQAAVKTGFLASATRKAGGDFLKGRYLYLAIGSAGQWGLFEKKFGRKDADGPDPAGRVPVWSELSAAETKDKLGTLGVKPYLVPAIAPFLGEDVDAVYAVLEQDDEMARYVNRYRTSRETVSENSYQVDLIATFTKVSILGAPIDTEAYTYKSTVFPKRSA